MGHRANPEAAAKKHALQVAEEPDWTSIEAYLNDPAEAAMSKFIQSMSMTSPIVMRVALCLPVFPVDRWDGRGDRHAFELR